MGFIGRVLRGNLLIFTLGDVIRQLSFFITFPYFSLYVQALGGNKVDIGIVNSFYPLAALFIYPLAGYFADRYSRVKIIVASGIILASTSLIFMLAPDWKFLALGSFLMGLMVFPFPAMNALMADSLSPGQRGIGYSLWLFFPSVAGIFSPYIGGYLSTAVGVEQAMRFLYGLTVVTEIGIAAMNFKLLQETKIRKDVATSKREFLKTLSNSYRDMFYALKLLPRSLKAFAFMLILSFFINNLTAPYWVVYAVEKIGLSELQWGTSLLIATIVNVVLLVPAGMLVDKFGWKKILYLASALLIIPIFLFPFSQSLTETSLSLATINIANAFLMSAAPSFMAHSVSADKRGRIMAALGQGMLIINTRGGRGGPGMGAVLSIPSVLGSISGGFIYGYNPILPWTLLASFTIINTIICVVFI
ncbi:MAG: MFS transporter, partial [Candidatus Bathyarchaeota archaeon]